jgi:hypothetical protein
VARAAICERGWKKGSEVEVELPEGSPANGWAPLLPESLHVAENANAPPIFIDPLLASVPAVWLEHLPPLQVLHSGRG